MSILQAYNTPLFDLSVQHPQGSLVRSLKAILLRFAYKKWDTKHEFLKSPVSW